MTEQLDDFFNQKGIKKIIPEFSPSQEIKIQSKTDELIKPALQKLVENLNSYENCKADMMTSKNKLMSRRENVELKFYRNTTLKFVYKPNFYIKDEKIFVTGQYSVANIYGEAKEFKNSELNKDIEELFESDINEDFLKVFQSNVEI